MIRDKGLATPDLEEKKSNKSSFLPPSHVVDGIGVLINVFNWKIYDPIIYLVLEN